jgi:hypothetical protein
MPTIIELPAGTYTLTGDVSGSRDVLTLTASITETTLSVGQTASITTNATAGTATYQWRLDGTPISGATSATYTTAATGALTCIVDSGAQSVTTAAVTVAAGAIDPVLIASRSFSGVVNGGTSTETNGFPSAGQYVVLILSEFVNTAPFVDVSAAGATVNELASLSSGLQVSGRALFVNATGAADCVFTNNSGGTILHVGAFIYNVTGATNAGAITQTGAGGSGASAVLASVPTGHSVIAGCYLRGTDLTAAWSGSLVQGDQDNSIFVGGNPGNRTAACASVVAATGGGNFTATVTPSSAVSTGVIAVALAKA